MTSKNNLLQLAEKSLVLWARKLTKLENLYYQRPIIKLLDIIQGNFLLNLLRKVKGFKLCSPITVEEQSDYLAMVKQDQDEFKRGHNEVFNCSLKKGHNIVKWKIIAKSTLQFYETKLLRNTTDISFNFIDMSENNSQEIIAYLTIIMGVVVSDENLLKIVGQDQIQQLDEQYKEMAYTFLQSAKQVGKKSHNSSSKKSPTHNRRLLNRLQQLQQEVQHLQVINEKLFCQKQQKQEQIRILTKKYKDVEQILNRQIQRKHNLQEQVQKHQSDMYCQKVMQEALQKKYNSLKKQHQQQIILNIELQNEQKKLTGKIDKISQRNKQLVEINEDLRQIIEQKDKNIRELEEIIKEEKSKEKINRNKLELLITEKMDLEVALQKLYLNKMAPIYNRNPSLEDSQNIDSDLTRFRNKQNLSWLNNKEANGEQPIPIFSKDNFDFIKENASFVIENKPFISNKKSEKKQSFHQIPYIPGQILHLQDFKQVPLAVSQHYNPISLTESTWKLMNDNHREEVMLLIMIIMDLTKNLAELREKFKIRGYTYKAQENDEENFERRQLYRKMVAEMFLGC